MYIRTEHKTSSFTRKSKLGKLVNYTKTKKIYIFNCDECNTEFFRDSNYTLSRLNNNFKHFCKKCKNKSTYVGLKNKQKLGPIKLGEKYIDSVGYVVIRLSSTEDYPGKKSSFYLFVREHVKIMQDHLGRKLLKNEVVHHIDGDKTNNEISNLDLCSVQEHNACHANSESIIFELYKPTAYNNTNS